MHIASRSSGFSWTLHQWVLSQTFLLECEKKKKLNFLPLLECKYFSFFTDYSHLCYIGNRVGFRTEKALLCSAAIKRFLTAEFPFHIGLPLLHFHAKCHAYCTKPNLHQRRKKKKQKLNCGLKRMHLRAESYATPKLFFLYFYFFKCVESYKTSRVHYVL